MALTISSCSSGFNSRFICIVELSHCSTRSSTRLIVSSLISFESMVKPVKSRGLAVEDSDRYNGEPKRKNQHRTSSIEYRRRTTGQLTTDHRTPISLSRGLVVPWSLLSRGLTPRRSINAFCPGRVFGTSDRCARCPTLDRALRGLA
jgi:hypothetical protein